MVTNYSTNTQQNPASDVAMESRLRIIVWCKWCEKTSRISLKVHIAQCVHNTVILRNACAMRAQYSDFAQCVRNAHMYRALMTGRSEALMTGRNGRSGGSCLRFVTFCDIL